MNIAPSRLRLKKHFFPVVQYEARAGVPVPKEPICPSVAQIAIQSGVFHKDGKWNLMLDVATTKASEKELPVKFRIVAFGTFELADGESAPEEEERLVRVNGLSILYSSMREMLHGVSLRGPYSAVHLPTIAFGWSKETDPPVHPALSAKGAVAETESLP